MDYTNEEEFLNNYDVKEYLQLSMTVDLLILSVSEEENSNYRKTSKKKMSLLLVKRDTFPYKNKYCLPGGFLNPVNETTEECAKRILEKEVNYSNIYLEQLYTFDGIHRDPRCRVISCAYIALVDKKHLEGKLRDNASWFDVSVIEKNNVITLKLDNNKALIEFKVQKKLKEHSIDRYDYKILNNSNIAFDHAEVIITGIERLRNKINYTDIVFNMIPKYFTLGELQQVYEVILGKKLLDSAFRRIITDKVKTTPQIKKGSGHRPSRLYEYKN